jgi:hypothetical protein
VPIAVEVSEQSVLVDDTNVLELEEVTGGLGVSEMAGVLDGLIVLEGTEELVADTDVLEEPVRLVSGPDGVLVET